METFALKGYLFIMIFYSTADIFSLLLSYRKYFSSTLNFFNLFSQLQHFFINLCNVNCTFFNSFRIVQHLFSHFYSKADIQESPSSSWQQNEPESQYS